MWNPSLVQCRPLASPHSGLRSLFSWVTWVHSPMRPLQTSGGALKELRMTALDLPSAVMEIPVSSKGGLMLSSPCHNRSTWPVAIKLRDRAAAVVVFGEEGPLAVFRPRD